MNFGLRRQLKGVTLTETPNRLPGSPEMIAAQIAEVERDIACWNRMIPNREILGDIALAEGRLHILRLQLAEVDRRKQNVPVPFPERRMVDSIIKPTE
jgi:hypothetical protein